MKAFDFRALALILVALAALAGTSRAQDFFRNYGTSRSSGGIGPVIPSEYSYQDARPSGLTPVAPVEDRELNDKYNFALGPIRFSLAAGLGLEFNDNVFLSENHRESDFVIRPSLNIEGTLKVSDMNTLKLGVDLSYAKYLNHSELDTDGVLISPTSELAFTFYVSEIKITVRDRFSYQEDTYDLPTLSGVSQYKRFENQAGIEFEWAMNENVNIDFGFDHFNLWAKGDPFSDEDHSVDTIFFKPSFKISATVKTGLVASYSFINFPNDERNSGNNIIVGPFLEWQITPATSLYLEAGIQSMNFDGSTTTLSSEVLKELTPEQRRGFQDDESNFTYYAKFELTNQPTDYFKHYLSGSKTSEIGLGTNFYDLYHVEYGAEWKNFIANTEFGPVLFAEHYETSGAFAERGQRYGAALGVRHHLTNSLTLGLDYRFLLKDSNLQGADYYQNLVFLSAYYKF